MQFLAFFGTKLTLYSVENSENKSISIGNKSISLSQDAFTTRFSQKHKQKIETDSSNVFVVERKKTMPIATKKGEIKVYWDVEQKSFANEFYHPDSKTVTEWRPAYRTGGLGVKIPAVACSSDQSVLAFAEITGSDKGPFGTRIIIVNTYNWEVMKLFEIPARISKMRWIPGNHFIISTLDSQEVLEQFTSVAIIDVDKEKISKLIPLSNDSEILDICSTKEFIYAIIKGKKCIYAYSLTDTEKKYEIECSDVPSALQITQDEQFLVSISQKFLNIYKLSDHKHFFTQELGLSWVPNHFQFVDASSKNFIVSPNVFQNVSPVMFQDGRKIEFEGKSAGYSLVAKDFKTAFIGYKINGKIDIIDPISTKILDTVSLEQVRPQTRGEPQYVMYLDYRDSLFVLDSNGNGYLVAKIDGQKRWKKAIIFTSKN